MHRAPADYKQTDFLPTSEFSTEVRVTPRVLYVFQVIAREEKGGLGVDYNKSPEVQFKYRTRTPNSSRSCYVISFEGPLATRLSWRASLGRRRGR